MNSSETQSGPDPDQYVDLEGPDESEQFFSASLEQATETPNFVADFPEAPPNAEPISSNEEVLGGRASRPPESGAVIEETYPSAHGTHEGDYSGSQPDWRDLVSAKVKHYKTVKPRKERYPSLQLQFDSRPAWKPDATVRAAIEADVFSPRPDSPELPREDPRASFPVTTEATARVLEFPRPGMLPFNPDELAGPVVDRPRIIEAPELLPPPPALGGILIPQTAESEPERQPGLDMPLATARLARKLAAVLVDAAVVLSALAIFGYMFLRFNSSLPPVRLTIGIAAGLSGILWFAYQFAFIIFCGTTPGLRSAQLRIKKFDGASVPRNLRRWRVLASVLSCVPLGLGYVWCFFDEDELSWHDRITKTHLAQK